MDLTSIKQRFDIIGNDPSLNHALEIAVQVATTDLSVLVLGESGVGKEVIPQIIHLNSARKHNNYFAVNCGAIPDGTIDSELFGHEKGSFTGATEMHKGYFEVADGGTIFLDEVADLPMATQVRLLRVIQNGEYMRVGSSKVMKTDVRVIAATNVDIVQAINAGKFREDLYYRLNTVPIRIPSLRERPEDVSPLFKKFALDFSDKYKMPAIRLTPEALSVLKAYKWPGNIRQLKSMTEQISILEQERTITPEILGRYLPKEEIHALPVKLGGEASFDYSADRSIIFKILYQMRTEIDSLKSALASSGNSVPEREDGSEAAGTSVIQPAPKYLLPTEKPVASEPEPEEQEPIQTKSSSSESGAAGEEEPKTIRDLSLELIKRALKNNGGKRKAAAEDLGISERTLYRKIKELSKDDANSI